MKSFKNVLGAIVACTMLSSSTLTTSAVGGGFLINSDEWRHAPSNITMDTKVSSYIGTDTDVVVPDDIDGFAVLEYSSSLFSYNSVVENITLNSKVSVVPDGMFNGTDNLDSIKYGACTTSIGKINDSGVSMIDYTLIENPVTLMTKSFTSCKNLTTLNLGDNVVLDDDFVYTDNPDLEVILGENNPMQIRDGSLYNEDCTRLLFFNDNNNSINRYALGVSNYDKDLSKLNNSSVTTVRLEDGIVEIPADYSCSSTVKTFVLPSTVEDLGEHCLGYKYHYYVIGAPDYELDPEQSVASNIGTPVQKYCLDNGVRFYPVEDVEGSVFNRFQNGDVTSKDALKALQQVVGLDDESGNSACFNDDVDVTRDGLISSADALTILQSVVNSEVEIPDFYGFNELVLKTEVVK